MVTRPSVSVVMPAHNRERLIRTAIASVQGQAGVDCEIVVVDDGSTDGTADIVRTIERCDARVQLIQTSWRGPAAARNRGIARANGQYLCFVDSDDLCPPGRILRQVAKLANRPDVTAVVGALLFFEDTDDPCPHVRHTPYHNAALHTAMFRTAQFRRFGPLDETLGFAEDVDFFLRLLEADVKLLLEADIASLYRQHPGNMTLDVRSRQFGYARAYARSIARRRAAGRTKPLNSFFPAVYLADTDFDCASPRPEHSHQHG